MNGTINLNEINEVILPLFIVENNDPTTYLGMGFTIADHLILTCWHCVDVTLKENENIAAIVVREGGQDHTVLYLGNIEQDANGLDLAIAAHGYKLSYPLELFSNDIPIGMDIWTYGRPHTVKQKIGNDIKFDSPLLYLKGYTIRTLNYSTPNFGQMPSFELSFAPPRGMSGAPILLAGTNKVVGLIYGSNDISMIEHTRFVDPETGVSEPEVHRIVSYGLAHHTRSLNNIRGQLTNGQPLGEFIRRR